MPPRKKQRVYENLMRRYNGCVPLIVEPFTEGDSVYLIVSYGSTFLNVLQGLRERVGLKSYHTLFLSLQDYPLNVIGGAQVGVLYDRYRSSDGFLYLHYMKEVSFG